MVIGENKKYLSCLLTLKVGSSPADLPGYNLSAEGIEVLKKYGIDKVLTVDDVLKNKTL